MIQFICIKIINISITKIEFDGDNMKNNIINEEKVLQVCKRIDDATNEIMEELNQITDLIEILPSFFYDERVIQICDEYKEKDLKKLQTHCTNNLKMKNILENILGEYKKVEEKYSSDSSMGEGI